MPTFICKIDDLYFEWSTIVDAPVLEPMPLDQYKARYLRRYGEEGMRELPARLARVDKYGTSSIVPMSLEEMVRANRAGPNETTLMFEELKTQLREAAKP